MTLLEAKRFETASLKRGCSEEKNGMRRPGGNERRIRGQWIGRYDGPDTAGAEINGDKLVQSNWYGECATCIKCNRRSYRRQDGEQE